MCDKMWADWYALPESTRTVLSRRAGGDFNAAWDTFGDRPRPRRERDPDRTPGRDHRFSDDSED